MHYICILICILLCALHLYTNLYTTLTIHYSVYYSVDYSVYYSVYCVGESVTGGHTVYVGLDMESGDLLAIYEWVLQCRTDKRGDTRRQKQVTADLMDSSIITLLLCSRQNEQWYQFVLKSPTLVADTCRLNNPPATSTVIFKSCN